MNIWVAGSLHYYNGSFIPTRQPFPQDGSYLPEIDKLWEYLSVFPSDNVPQKLGVFIAQGSSRFEDIHRYTPYIEQN